MATPPDYFSHSEHSIPEMNLTSDTIEPTTPPIPPHKSDNYYNYPGEGPELKSSTTNINMQSNPMYQDTEGGVPQRRASQKQVVVEKIEEGNPDAQSPSSNLISNVKIYERLDSILPTRFGLSPRYSYSPNKKTDRDSAYQYLGTIHPDTNQALDGLPVSLPASNFNSIARVCLQIFFSVILILTLFIAVVALVTAILSISAANTQTEEIARMLEQLTPLIDTNSTYGMLVENITDTQRQLDAFRNETLHSIATLRALSNCSAVVKECDVDGDTSCTTENTAVDTSTHRLTGISCVTSYNNAKSQIVHNNSSYMCYCNIAFAQTFVWKCEMSLFLCSLGN